MKSHVGFVQRPRMLGMHAQTIGAAIDLRHAEFHKKNQLGIQSAVLDICLYTAHRRKTGRCDGKKVNSLLNLFHHSVSPPCLFLYLPITAHRVPTES